MRIVGPQLRSILRRRAAAAILLLAAVAGGCRDLLVQPAPGAAALNLAVAPAAIAADGVDDAFDRADNVRVRIVRPGQPTIEEIFPFSPADETRISIRVELSQDEEPATILVELRRGSEVLFQAEQSVVLRPGETPAIDLEIEPVAARVEIAGSPSVLRPEVGDTIQLRAAVLMASGDTLPGAPIVWSTTDAGVARVDPTGRVAIVGYGDAEVRATSGALSASVDFEVIQRVGAVIVEPTSLDLEVDGTAQLSATVYDTRGNLIAGRGVAWSSSGPEVAVSATGVVTGVAPGEATVTAELDGVKGTTSVRVREEGSEPEPEPEPNPFLGYWQSGSYNGEEQYVWGIIQDLVIFETEGTLRGSMMLSSESWGVFSPVPTELYNVYVEGDTLVFHATLSHVEATLNYNFRMTMDAGGDSMSGTGAECWSFSESSGGPNCELISVYISRGTSQDLTAHTSADLTGGDARNGVLLQAAARRN